MTTVEIDGSLDGPLDGGRSAGPPEPHVPPRLHHWRQRTSTPLLVIGIGTLPLLLLELVRDDLGYRDRVFLDVVNVGVLALFLLDYLIELSLARGHRREFVRAEWAQALIVLAQIAALAPMLAGAGAVRAVRGARALRGVAAILRALALGGAVAADGRRALRRHAAGFAMAVAGLTWVSSAVGFTLAGGGPVTVTCLVAVSVAPSSSVTVRVTV